MSFNENKCDCNCIVQEKVDRAKLFIKNIGKFDQVSDFFKTFADETRMKIICALDVNDSMCVCDIAVSLNMTKSAISHQLKYLKENNLVDSNKVGKVVYYSLKDKHVKDILEIGLEHVGESK